MPWRACLGCIHVNAVYSTLLPLAPLHIKTAGADDLGRHAQRRLGRQAYRRTFNTGFWELIGC